MRYYTIPKLTKILVLQKRALRFIFFAERCEHAVPLFIHADILPLNFLYFKSVCCLMHDVRNRKVPNNILNKEIIKVREWIPYIVRLTKVIRLKLFLDIVPSSSEDITRAMRGQPKRVSRNYQRKNFICFGFVSYRRCFLLSQPPFCTVGLSFVFLLVWLFIILLFIRF